MGLGPWAAHQARLHCARVWLSPLLCWEHEAAQEGTHRSIGRDQLDQEPSRAARGKGGELGGKRKIHGAVATSRLWLPASSSRAMEEARAAIGALTFAPRASHSGNPGTTCPVLCKHPATLGGRDSRRMRPAMAEMQSDALLGHDPARYGSVPAPVQRSCHGRWGQTPASSAPSAQRHCWVLDSCRVGALGSIAHSPALSLGSLS